MSSTTTTNNNPYEVAEDFNVSSDLPLRLASSVRQNSVSITPSVLISSSSVSESTQASVTPSGPEDTDATSTIFGISFPPAPPPNTPADNNDAVSASSEPSPKSGWTGEYSQSDPGAGWTGEYSDPGTPTTSMSKLRWTGEYSTSGVEPEHLMARLSTVANKSEDASVKFQTGEEVKSSGENSLTKEDENASIVRGISSEEEEVAKLARQAIWRVTPRSVKESLDIKQVKSGVVTITNSAAQPQSAVLCTVGDEYFPEAEEAPVSSPTEATSPRDAKFVKGENDNSIGSMGCCMSVFKMRSRPKPQVPVNQPKHATLSPDKSCLRPTTSLAGTVLDRIEEDSPLELVPAPKPSGGKRVTFDLDEPTESDESKPRPKPKSKSYFNFNMASSLLNRMRSQETEDSSDEEELDDPDSPFAAQDLEIQRRLARADSYRDANERASIIRGALDFLLVVSDRVDSVAAGRISDLLDKTGNRCLGSYTGEEKDHVNPHQYGNKVDQKLYRSKETAMSYLRRRQPRKITRLGTPYMRDCPQFYY
ncbi:uncharacterized protein FSUBG_2039 [Fusarium subglutinans]|uniref:Uncharacterized protein n=1 Tax=Gibberella subglutinans TaxID=42677 RepID=A0A8H5QBS5_GIBSU|nr:uncharacterized protein FSUBG_2039 [Fusarium subglutinans]KAF5611602.1 hypothetical protein FSUBG_2039 [Fusarium subglutinans]